LSATVRLAVSARDRFVELVTDFLTHVRMGTTINEKNIKYSAAKKATATLDIQAQL
jgi:hypothetical protein